MASCDEPIDLAQIITQTKQWIERCGWVWVEAQIIELTRRNARIQFLTLRDLHCEISARITCTQQVLDAAGPLSQGTTVSAHIRPRLWTKTSQLTFECSQIVIRGEGRLLAQLEELKRSLYAEGLFDPRRKRPLPFLPTAIGLITGAGSAAERDVITNIKNRWAQADIRTHHALVQGPSAVDDIIAALDSLENDCDIDVIIIARGGGSLEDLLPFSDERLVRRVSSATTPIISAIGHEPDTPILDLVADMRASTPTDAAKRVVPNRDDEYRHIEITLSRIRQAISAICSAERRHLSQITSRPAMANPSGMIRIHYDYLGQMRTRLNHAINRHLDKERMILERNLTSLRTLAPKATLERGYAIVVDDQGTSITSVHDVEAGDQIEIYLSDGTLIAEVDYQE